MNKPEIGSAHGRPASQKKTGRARGWFLSECGTYVCRAIPGLGCDFEAWTIDGLIHWENDDRIQTWEDARKPRHPLPYAVGGYSAEKIGQKPRSFTLSLLHCDTAKIIDPYRGNTILEKVDVVFRRRLRWIPKALRGSK